MWTMQEYAFQLLFFFYLSRETVALFSPVPKSVILVNIVMLRDSSGVWSGQLQTPGFSGKAS